MTRPLLLINQLGESMHNHSGANLYMFDGRILVIRKGVAPTQKFAS